MHKKPVQDIGIFQRAVKFHSKIRKQQVELVLKQKRSKFHLNQQLNIKTTSSLNFIETGHQTDEIYELWQTLSQQGWFNIPLYLQSAFQLESKDLQVFKTSMRRFQSIISLIVKQINGYNQFLMAKIQPVVKQSIQMKNQINIGIVQQKIQNELSILYKVFLACMNIVESLIDLTNKNTINLPKKSVYLVQIANILIEMSYFKSERYSSHQSALIQQYKQTNIYQNINKFSHLFKNQCLNKLYPYCFRILQHFIKIEGQKIQKEKKIFKEQQNLINKTYRTEADSVDKAEFELGLFSIMGNIISDYQPNILIKQLPSSGHYQNGVKINVFSIQDLSIILQNIEMMRIHQFQKYWDFDKNQRKNVQMSAVQCRICIDFIQTGIWFSRLSLIGGWITRQNVSSYNYSHNNNQQHYIYPKHHSTEEEKHNIYRLIELIKIISIQQILDIIGLVKDLQIHSSNFLRKVTKVIYQALLVCELSYRENANPISSQTQLKKRYQLQTLLKKQFSQKQFLCLVYPLRKFISFIQNECVQSKSDLILINQIYNDLINLCETVLGNTIETQLMFMIKNEQSNNSLKQFVIDCSKGAVSCTQLLNLPILIMHKFNNRELCSKSQQISQFIYQIYTNFISSLNFFAPIHMYNQNKMLSEQEQVYQKGVFNNQYLKKKFALSPSHILSYFVQNSTKQSQSQYYANYFRMLQECLIYSAQQRTKSIQKKLVYNSNNFSNNESKMSENNKNYHSEQIQIAPQQFISQDFITKLFYMIVDHMAEFDQNSAVHLEVLYFIKTLILLEIDQQLERFVRECVIQNLHGIRLHLQAMSLWESQIINSLVVQIFELLQIQQ